MDHTNIASKSQGNIHVQSKIDDFFDRFSIGTLCTAVGYENITVIVFAL